MSVKLFSVFAVAIILSGCSSMNQDSTVLIPKQNHRYEVLANAEEQMPAQKAALDRANRVCQEQGKSLEVLSSNTQYQGSGKELATATAFASKAAFMNGSSTFVPSSKTDNDYQTKIEFKCV